MQFTIGQTVVHPYHGLMEVTSIRERHVRGEARDYVQFFSERHGLSLAVPVDDLDKVSIRPVSSTEQIEALLALLRAPTEMFEGGWSRRLKGYQERLSGGRIIDTCWVARQIMRDGHKAPASAEGRLLRDILVTLSTEFSLALDVDRDEAAEMIRTAVLGDLHAELSQAS
ncbi:CarD family transcriptional regulator [Agreia sp. VKM Ac-1783]|uniref:CarD family transcriptional regulator n=1 Tax=Agreia sp. VKM Ac-1783 TaxID=1938889 RepID=UPI000A2ADEBD|nr:CarD family transcriptional regulator [Agreia sp. VKM Ac-1783]SMQ67515.1 transcriptional regulator, CarD family [Agreia sp. VKM Ac-1783]